jgi:hypothetical protein
LAAPRRPRSTFSFRRLRDPRRWSTHSVRAEHRVVRADRSDALARVGFRTRFGGYMYIVGGGEAVPRMAGMPIRISDYIKFTLSLSLSLARWRVSPARWRPRDLEPLVRPWARIRCLTRSQRSRWEEPCCRAGVGGVHRPEWPDPASLPAGMRRRTPPADNFV